MIKTKPTIKQIKSLATERSFERGEGYFEDKSIKSATISYDEIHALVTGTEEYKVSISGYDFAGCYCTCPYNYDGVCKHIVAVLLHTSKHFKRMKKAESKRNKMLEKLFFKISTDKLKNFVRKEMERSQDFEARFIEHFKKGHDVPETDYKPEINLLFKDTKSYGVREYGNEIDFTEFTRMAKIKEKKKDYHSACKIYQDVSEAIAENMEDIDDYDDYYRDCFSDAIRKMISCISKQKLPHQEKQQYISYMFEKYIKNNPDYFTEYYVEGLKLICTNSHDHTYWKNILEPYLPKRIPSSRSRNKGYDAYKKIWLQIYILKKLHDKSVPDIYARHYCKDEDICIAYIRYLERNDPKKALQIMHRGIKCHPESIRLKETVLSTYSKKDKRYHEMILKLYLETQGSKYYSKLKSLPNWNKTLKKIIRHFKKYGTDDSLIDIYLTEKMTAKAIQHIIVQKDLDLLLEYHDRLAPLYPHKYFRAYSKLVPKFANSDVGRRHYETVREYLKKIKTIRGHKKKFTELVYTIQEKNLPRPVFIKILKKI